MPRKKPLTEQQTIDKLRSLSGPDGIVTSHSKLAKLTKRSKATIGNWIRKWTTQGLIRAQELPRNGGTKIVFVDRQTVHPPGRLNGHSFGLHAVPTKLASLVADRQPIECPESVQSLREFLEQNNGLLAIVGFPGVVMDVTIAMPPGITLEEVKREVARVFGGMRWGVSENAGHQVEETGTSSWTLEAMPA